MVTTVSNSYCQDQLRNVPLLPLSDFQLKVSSAVGEALPYYGCLEVEHRLPGCNKTCHCPGPRGV